MLLHQDYIGERVPSLSKLICDLALTLTATKSAAIFEHFPGPGLQFHRFYCHVLGKVSAVADMNFLVSFIETIKGRSKRTSVIWKQQMIFLEPS